MRRVPDVWPDRGRAGQQVRLPSGLHRRQRHRLRRARPLHALAQRPRPHAGMMRIVNGCREIMLETVKQEL